MDQLTITGERYGFKKKFKSVADCKSFINKKGQSWRFPKSENRTNCACCKRDGKPIDHKWLKNEDMC